MMEFRAFCSNPMEAVPSSWINSVKTTMMEAGTFNSFDFDGVITVGLIPRAIDIVVTGRAIDEKEAVFSFLRDFNIVPREIHFCPITKANGRTRWISGIHKANVLFDYMLHGAKIGTHFDDDALQIQAINQHLGYLIALLRTGKYTKFGVTRTPESHGSVYEERYSGHFDDVGALVRNLRLIHVDSHFMEK